jgi:putative spermidine/putrescine transport system substrate-binding protein
LWLGNRGAGLGIPTAPTYGPAMAASTLPRRRLLHLAAFSGLSLLAGCRQSRSPLLVSRGDFPSAWAARLPRDWSQQLLDDPETLLQTLRTAEGARTGLLQLWDGWASSLPPNRWQPFPAGDLPGGLIALAAPVSRLFAAEGSPTLAFPWAIDPWVLLLRDRPDLARRAAEGWNLLLDPSLQGRLVLPSSPRLSITLMGADPQRLRQLRRAALANDERHGLNLLLAGEAEALVLPRRRAVPLLRSDPRLTVVLPPEGAPLGWNLLLRPAGVAVQPPRAWLAELLTAPLLSRLLASGWVPPLPRARLEAAAASLPAVQRALLMPPQDLLDRCWSLPPLDARERARLQALWDGASP